MGAGPQRQAVTAALVTPGGAKKWVSGSPCFLKTGVTDSLCVPFLKFDGASLGPRWDSGSYLIDPPHTLEHGKNGPRPVSEQRTDASSANPGGS